MNTDRQTISVIFYPKQTVKCEPYACDMDLCMFILPCDPNAMSIHISRTNCVAILLCVDIYDFTRIELYDFFGGR